MGRDATMDAEEVPDGTSGNNGTQGKTVEQLNELAIELVAAVFILA